jgi:hypothetical protein
VSGGVFCEDVGGEALGDVEEARGELCGGGHDCVSEGVGGNCERVSE